MLAALFPGQGSHGPDDRFDVERQAPDLLARCIELVGEDPFGRQAESTRFAQPAIFLTSIARWREKGGLRPTGPASARKLASAPVFACFAGHSLGELSALTAAGVFSEEDALRLVVERGRLMAEAQDGGMLVVRADAEDVVDPARASGVTIANDNAPGQVVLSGSEAAIDDVAWRLRAAGMRSMRLGVTGAFHSPLMQPAADAFASVLADVEVRPASAPVLCCATALPFEDVRAQLAGALTTPVRWREVVLTLHERGVDHFVDVGPGRVLGGLVAKTLKGAEFDVAVA